LPSKRPTIRICGPTGTSSGQARQDLDRHKNRFIPPTPAQMDPSVTLYMMLQPGDDVSRFDEEKGARLIGYVVDVREGGIESCNCRAKDPVDRDTHIELALSRGAGSAGVMVVKVTPRFRARVKAQGVDWSTGTLRRLKGQFAEVTGWLLFDMPHINEAENTNPGGSKNWRATCWEIHPVTSLKVVAAPPVSVPADVLADAQRKQAQALTPAQREQLARRNVALLDKFDIEHLDEDDPSTVGEPDRKGSSGTPK
jgi:hypothetical protein